MRRRPIHLPARLCSSALLLLAGCAPLAESPDALPSAAGVYPAAQRVEPGPASRGARDAGWRPADGRGVQLTVDASPSAFLAALPPTGARVPVRTIAWPCITLAAGVRTETTVVIEDLNATRPSFDGFDVRLPLEQRKPLRSSARAGVTP